MASMQALVITRPGGPEVLELRSTPVPEPAPGEALVRVRAAGLNRADLLQRQGRYPAPRGSVADVAGLEYAGEIAALGPGVEGWAVGERVFGVVGGGAHAEYVLVPAATMARVPGSLDWSAAGAVPEAFITAHDALTTQGGLRAGERVVVDAVGSGVGLAAVQVARALGARVFGTTRTPAKLDRARSTVGLEDGTVLQDGPGELAGAVRAWAGGDGAELMVDLVGGDYVPAGLEALATRGRLVLVGLLAGRRASLDLGVVLSRRLTVRGTVLRSRPVEEKAAATAGFVADVVPQLAAGRMHPVVDSVFPLSDAPEAHARLESGETFGKVVLLL